MKKYIMPLIEVRSISLEDMLLTSFNYGDVDDLDKDPFIDEEF